MDDVESARQAACVAPHSPGNGITGESETLPQAMGQQRERFEEIAPAWKTGSDRITADLNAVDTLFRGWGAGRVHGPKGLEGEGRRGEDANLISSCNEITAQAGKIGF